MKKLISAIAIGLLFVSSAARADKMRSAGSHSFFKEHNLRLGVDTEVGIPLGNYADANSVGGGAFLIGELALLEQLSATMRIGFQAHLNRTVAGADSHVNALPVLLGAKYYVGPDREGMFGAFEFGMFDLMSSVSRGAISATSNDVRFGMGAGIGYQQNQWSARVNVHTQDVGNFGNAMMITGGIGYQFAGL
ncbi:MAG TPA: hypothetical protein VKC57_11105 [Ktedonobacterales bacterium]|nr:hypothetical protein [Ktedonobacterales bacterium]